LANVQTLTEEAIRQTWFKLGDDLKKRASEEILRKPKHGRLYLRRDSRGRRRFHRASAPGEIHANMTGALRRAIAWNVHGNLEMTFGYGLVNKKSPEYDLYVEFGTRKMAQRRSLGQTIDLVQANTQMHFEGEMSKEFVG